MEDSFCMREVGMDHKMAALFADMVMVMKIDEWIVIIIITIATIGMIRHKNVYNNSFK